MLALLIALMAMPAASAAAQPAGVSSPVAASTPIDVEPVRAASSVESTFPVGLTIRADLAWAGSEDLVDIELLYSLAGDDTEILEPVAIGVPGDATIAGAEAVLDLQSLSIPPGVDLAFHWRIVSDATVLAESAPETTTWYDTRHDWQEVATDQVTIHSYGLGPAFAGNILDSAQSTVTELEQRFQLERSAPLSIWIYPNAADFRAVMPPNSRETISGASFPGYDLIVAIIPDGNTAEIGRVILHEISHQVLYQATLNPFAYPPLWFDEGMATHFQVGGNGNYLAMARLALEDGTLFALDSLDVSFPYTPARATLAYAASWSAVEYIMQTYGDEGIARLIAAFATGAPQDDAIEQALGVDMAQLEANWREWLAGQAT